MLLTLTVLCRSCPRKFLCNLAKLQKELAIASELHFTVTDSKREELSCFQGWAGSDYCFWVASPFLLEDELVSALHWPEDKVNAIGEAEGTHIHLDSCSQGQDKQTHLNVTQTKSRDKYKTIQAACDFSFKEIRFNSCFYEYMQKNNNLGKQIK